MLGTEEEEPVGEKIDYNDGHSVLQGKVLKRRLSTLNYITPCFSPEWVVSPRKYWLGLEFIFIALAHNAYCL